MPLIGPAVGQRTGSAHRGRIRVDLRAPALIWRRIRRPARAPNSTIQATTPTVANSGIEPDDTKMYTYGSTNMTTTTTAHGTESPGGRERSRRIFTVSAWAMP